jgi:hypothetical protein
MRTTLLAFAVLGTLGLASTARAECRQESAAPIKTKVEIINGKRVTVIETDIVICGHRARPAVAYVTSPKSVDYTWQSLTKDLVPLILESVKHGDIR